MNSYWITVKVTGSRKDLGPHKIYFEPREGLNIIVEKKIFTIGDVIAQVDRENTKESPVATVYVY